MFMKTHYTVYKRVRALESSRQIDRERGGGGGRQCAVRCIHLSARIEIDDRARADDNCAKSFGQAQQQMVIDKAINHSFRSRELY